MQTLHHDEAVKQTKNQSNFEKLSDWFIIKVQNETKKDVYSLKY